MLVFCEFSIGEGILDVRGMQSMEAGGLQGMCLEQSGDSGKYSWNGELWPFPLVLLHHLNLTLWALGSH